MFKWFLEKIVTTFITLLNSRSQKTKLHHGQWNQRLDWPLVVRYQRSRQQLLPQQQHQLQMIYQLSKWWYIESYISNCDVTGRSKEEQRAIKTLEQTTRFNGERYEVGLLWRDDEVKLPNNFYSAMGQFKSLERRLQKDETLKKRY